MKYIVIGLGNFGSVLSEELTRLGNEVVGTDMNAARVDNMKDKIAAVMTLDASQPDLLKILPLKDVDAVVVAIGENFGMSVKVVSLLKQSGVANIYARAIDSVHRSVLEALGVAKILTPEEDAAAAFARSIEFGGLVSSFSVGMGYYVMKFIMPDHFAGSKYIDLKLDENYRIRLFSVIRIRKGGSELVDPTKDDSLVESGDEAVAYGKYKDFRDMKKAF